MSSCGKADLLVLFPNQKSVLRPEDSDTREGSCAVLSLDMIRRFSIDQPWQKDLVTISQKQSMAELIVTIAAKINSLPLEVFCTPGRLPKGAHWECAKNWFHEFRRHGNGDFLTYCQKRICEEMIKAIEAFCSQYADDPLEKSYNIAKETLETKGRLFGSLIEIKAWKDLSIDDRYTNATSIFIDKVWRKGGFLSGAWSPQDAMKSLRNEIKEHGPLYVHGNFSRHSYVDDPTQIASLEGRVSIYGWTNSERQTRGDVLHSIVLLGINEGELCLYCDPNDQDKDRPIYGIPYQRLKEDIRPIFPIVTMQQIEIEGAPFTLYHPSFMKD